MAEFPAFPVFVDRYFVDTDHLTDVEHGRYLQILMRMWIAPQNRLPNDDVWLARKFRRSVEQVRSELRPIISEFCQCDGNWITQKGLGKVSAYKRKQSKAQSDRANLRWQQEKELSRNDAAPHPPGNASNPIQSSQESASPNPFDQADAALRAIPGISGHPVAVAPSIAPIWALLQQGFDLKTQIIPSIKTQLARRKGRPISDWSYFVPGIRESVAGPQATAPVIDAATWVSRLGTARRLCQWDAKWGPMPGQPGCIVPADLLLPGDGKGWQIWKPEAA